MALNRVGEPHQMSLFSEKMKMKKEIETYLQNRDKIFELGNNLETFTAMIEGKKKEIRDEFDKEISKLEKQKYELIQEKEELLEKKSGQTKSLLDELRTRTDEVDRSKHFFEYYQNIKDISHVFDDSKAKPAVKRGKELSLTKYGEFYKDEYLHIKLYITENEKSKNQFSLVAMGLCAFGRDENLSLPYSYGMFFIDDLSFGQHNIRTVIKDFPSFDLAKRYAENNKSRILKSFLDKYSSVKKFFKATISHFNEDDFQPLQKVKELADEDAPLICKIDDAGFRLYKGHYFREAEEEVKNPGDYIKVKDKIYQSYCPQALMAITRTGNISFGNWWSLHIEKTHCFSKDKYFNESNFKRTKLEAELHIKKHNRSDETSLSIPKIEWLNPGLIEKIPELD